VIDGGVFDNTGLTTLRCLLERLERLSKATKGDPELRSKAQDVLKRLRLQGVVLLEIDSGAKQSEPGWLARIFGGLLEPVTAFTNTSYSTAGFLREHNIEAIRNLLASKEEPSSLKQRIEHLPSPALRDKFKADLAQLQRQPVSKLCTVTVVCNDEDQVMTAWALSNEDIAKICSRFVVARKELHHRLIDALETYCPYQELEKRVADLEENKAEQPPQENEIRNVIVDYSNAQRGIDTFNLETKYNVELDRLYAKGGSQARIDAIVALKNVAAVDRERLVNAINEQVPAAAMPAAPAPAPGPPN
jgi:hypothetical protein